MEVNENNWVLGIIHKFKSLKNKLNRFRDSLVKNDRGKENSYTQKGVY